MSNRLPLMVQSYAIMLPVSSMRWTRSTFLDARRTSSVAFSCDADMITPSSSFGRTFASGLRPEPVRTRAMPPAFFPSARATSGKTPSARVTRTS